MRAFCSLIAVLAACSPAHDPETQRQLDTFEQQFAGGKGDGFEAANDPCSNVHKLTRHGGNDMLHAAFFLGYGGEGALGVVGFEQGMDFVFDIYHRQLSASNYTNLEARTPGLAVGVEGYVGVGFGLDHGVADWDGFFASYEGEVSLPFLEDYASAQVTVFQTGRDGDGEGVLSPGELVAPPGGVYGFSLGVNGSLAVPTGLPFEGIISSGEWVANKRVIRKLHDELADTLTVWPDQIDVRLVDAHTGLACDPRWPARQGWRECVIAFGDEDEGPLGAALDEAFAICHLSGGCNLPLSLPMALMTVAIGSLQDIGGTCD